MAVLEAVLEGQYITDEPEIKTEVSSLSSGDVYVNYKLLQPNYSYFEREHRIVPAFRKNIFWCKKLMEEKWTRQTYRISKLANKYKLKYPLLCNIEKSDDLFIAIAEDLDLFGYGQTAEESLQDLEESIIELYDKLKTEIKRLGPLLEKDFNYLNKVIEDVNVSKS